MQNLEYQEVWTVATIQWPQAILTPSTEIFDCSSNWYSGCQEALPFD